MPISATKKGTKDDGKLKKVSNWHNWEMDFYCFRDDFGMWMGEWESTSALTMAENPTEMAETKLLDWKVCMYDLKNSTVAPWACKDKKFVSLKISTDLLAERGGE